MDKTSTERSPKRFEGYIEELKDVLAGKGLSSGRPRDLVSVARALHPPGAVREDTASVIRSILSREAVGLSRAEVATMLVVAVGGPNLYVSGQEVDAVGQLDSFVDWVMAPLANVSLGGDPVAQAVEPFWGIVGVAPAQAGDTRDHMKIEPIADSEVEVDADEYPDAAVFALPKRSNAPWIAGVCAGVVLLAAGLTWMYKESPRGEEVPNAPQVAANTATANGLPGPAGAPASQTSDANLVVPTSSAVETSQNPSASGSPGMTGAGSGAAPVLNVVAAQSGKPTDSSSAASVAPPAATEASVAPPPAEPVQHPAPTPRSVSAAGKPAATPGAASVASTVPGGPFVVSSGVMSGNLITAPQPAYPKMAKMWGIQGEVVLQAIVSRKGQVVAAHALDGHKLLRAAATNAVKKWRYKPYMKNGKATDVDTVVIVDFKLPS